MLYAAYGSNLHPHRLTERTPSASFVGTAFLDGWSLHFHKRGRDTSGKCNIEPGGTGVYLALYELHAVDQRRLDRFEGNGYARTSVHVAEFGECLTYTALPGAVDDELRPFDWYLELVMLGARQHAFDGSYVERLATIETIEDPHTGRREEHFRLIESIREA